MNKPVPQDPHERIKYWEWALDILAARIDQLGDAGMVYLPLFERTERELAADRAKLDTLMSVKQRIARRQQNNKAQTSTALS